MQELLLHSWQAQDPLQQEQTKVPSCFCRWKSDFGKTMWVGYSGLLRYKYDLRKKYRFGFSEALNAKEVATGLLGANDQVVNTFILFATKAIIESKD
jgi:hypothetical protein